MAVNKKNLRVCQVTYLSKLYDVIVAVATLDEIDNILQEWALSKWNVALDLPSALVYNKDITEILTSVDTDSYAYLQSPVAAYMDMPRYSGISGDLPVFPTALNLDGKYVIPTCLAFLWSEPGFEGYFGEYIIPESQAFTLAAGANYIGINFNTGSPIYSIYSDFSSFDFSSIIPVVTVLNFASGISVIPWGQTGYGLPEKRLKLQIDRKHFEVMDAYTLTAADLYIQLGEIVVNNGVAEITCEAVDTETVDNDMYLHYKDSSSVWQNTKVTQIDNLQYQGASGLANLGSGEFVINNIFRVPGSVNPLLFSVLSNKFTSLQSALNSKDVTDLPTMFKGTAVLVGRVIVEKSAATATVQILQKNPWGVA